MPTLSAGKHRRPQQGACFMEFASYLAGERFSDHPACTHPSLAALARDVNDLTTDRARDALMPLVSRVIGLNGDHPLIGPTIAVTATSAALPVVSYERQNALAVGLLMLLQSSDSTELREVARAALAAAPDSHGWARAYLAASTRKGKAFTERSLETMVHTATVGISLACVTDPDRRLAALLESAVGATEALLSARAPSRTLQLA